MNVITEVLKSFSSTQLRDLAFAMNSRGGVEIPAQRLSKEALFTLLNERSTDPTLSLFAHRIETVTPYKHLFVYSLDAQFTYDTISARIKEAFPQLLNSIREVEPDLHELAPQACVTDELLKRVYLKLVHQVEMSGWVSVSPTEKRLETHRRRHPVIITFRTDERLLTIGFPGFTYTEGMQHEERTPYAEIAAEAATFLKKKLTITGRPFNAKPAIDALLEAEPDEVRDIKRNVRPKKGGRFGFDAGEENKLTTALAEFLTSEGDIPVTETQIRGLLRRSGASDILLGWKSLQILTRVALFQGAPELLFIWREAGPSTSVVDAVLKKLTQYGNMTAGPDVDGLRKELAMTPIDGVVRVPLIAQHHGVSQTEALKVLTSAVTKGEYQPCFRVNTDHLLMEFANTWRTSLLDFPPIVTDEYGNAIDLRVPSNIEVAFQRAK
ncbi:hypothetical protein [Paludibaculum fermentans]|uniref:hypothetical protein n=1 Tax=Paludibaculum fermentans TaxID=1473598 RepID=UPI003EB6DF39